MNPDIQVSHCHECHSTGYVSGLGRPVSCPSCNGTGHIIQIREVFVPLPGEPAAHVVEGSIGTAADADIILKNPNWKR